VLNWLGTKESIVKLQSWQSDPERYDFRHTLVPQYSHMDTIRHVNNVAVHGMHLEARVRHQLAVLGQESLFSDDVLLRPQRTVTHFLRETHFPHDVLCTARLIAVERERYHVATALFQQDECVGVQQAWTGAWEHDGWTALPPATYDALVAALSDTPAPIDDWPEKPLTQVDMSDYPVAAEISGRYADLDPDVVIGELAISRFAEQSRAGTLKPIRNDPALGLLVASVDLSYHRWRRGAAAAQVTCGVERIGNSSFALAGAVAVDSVRLASARSTMVLIDHAQRRPTPIDAPLRRAMEPLSIDTHAAQARMGES